MTELLPAFRFRVRLERAALPGRTGLAPPALATAPTAAARAGGPARPAASAAAPARATPPAPDQLGDGGFAECSGLDLESEIRELAEGGRNDGVVRRVGRAKIATITLKRGMFVPSPRGRADTALWDWLRSMLVGDLPVVRYDGHVEVFDAAWSRVLAHWSFDRGLPLKVSGPALNAKTGEIAVEELQIAHEGLRLERS